MCERARSDSPTLVLWGPIWRADQKDIGERETAAEQGLNRYFAALDCSPALEVRRLPRGTLGSFEAARALAELPGGRAGQVIFIAVRELGPVVKLLSGAALVEGGTEVVLDIAAHDLAQGRRSTYSVHWRHGGAGVIKGVATLSQDMHSALAAALGEGQQRPQGCAGTAAPASTNAVPAGSAEATPSPHSARCR